MIAHVALEDRDLSVPPCDSLAEAVVLDYLLSHPDEVPRHDLQPQLVFPEHQLLWRAMRMAHQPDIEPGPFYAAFLGVLRRMRPKDWRRYLDVLEGDQRRRAWNDWVDRRVDDGQHIRDLLNTGSDWRWWLERLERIAEARRIIDESQKRAERAWLVDIGPEAASARRLRAQLLSE